MGFDAFLKGINIVMICLYIFIGIIFISMDFRHMSAIKFDCASKGYIQNDKYRIYCNVEGETK